MTMETPLVVDLTDTQESSEEEKGEDGPFPTSGVDTNNQQLSSPNFSLSSFIRSFSTSAATPNSSESQSSEIARLRADNARLSEKLALSEEREAEKDAEIAKLKQSLKTMTREHMGFIQGFTESFMKEDKSQNISHSKQLDQLAKYVEEQENNELLDWDTQCKMRLQSMKNLSKIMSIENEKSAELLKPFNLADLERDEESDEEEKEIGTTPRKRPDEEPVDLAKKPRTATQ